MPQVQRLLCCLLVIAAASRADVVTAGVISTLVAPASGVGSMAPSVASAPTGETLVAWVRFPSAGTNYVINLTFLSRTGTIVSGPTPLTLGAGQLPYGVVVGASPSGFIAAFEATPAAGQSARDIFYRTFNLTGTQTGSGQANTLTNLDESRPSCDGFVNGNFVIAWVRKAGTVGGLSSGVYCRRFTATGAAVDAAEIRSDVTGQNYGSQDASGVSTWPSGKFIVTWQDGTGGAAPGPNSPDGQGQGILARVHAATGTATGLPFVVNSITALDQFEPAVSCDDRNTCVIGWCGDTNASTVDAYVRRFDDTGLPYDFADINLTPANAYNQFLMGVGMASNGECVATWMDEGVTPGESGRRTAFARLDQFGSITESRVIESGAGSNESHVFPRIGVDQYGNFQIAQQVNVTGIVGTDVGVRHRRFQRAMIVPSTTTPAPGTSFSILLDSPSDANAPYVLACSAGLGPTPIDTRTLRLNLDVLFDLSVFQGGAGIFNNFLGTLGVSGTTSAPSVVVPNLPQLSGATLYFAYATGRTGTPNGINTISDTASITIQ